MKPKSNAASQRCAESHELSLSLRSSGDWSLEAASSPTNIRCEVHALRQEFNILKPPANKPLSTSAQQRIGRLPAPPQSRARMTPFAARAIVDKLLHIVRRNKTALSPESISERLAADAPKELLGEVLAGGPVVARDTLRILLSAALHHACSEEELGVAETAFAAGLARRVAEEAKSECENRQHALLDALNKARGAQAPGSPPWSVVYTREQLFAGLLQRVTSDVSAVAAAPLLEMALQVASSVRITEGHAWREGLTTIPAAKSEGERFLCAYHLGSSDGALVTWLLSQRTPANEIMRAVALAKACADEAARVTRDDPALPLGARLDACAPSVLAVLRGKRLHILHSSPSEANFIAAAERSFMAGRNFLRFRPDMMVMLDSTTRGSEALVVVVTLLLHRGANLTLLDMDSLTATLAQALTALGQGGQTPRPSHV